MMLYATLVACTTGSADTTVAPMADAIPVVEADIVLSRLLLAPPPGTAALPETSPALVGARFADPVTGAPAQVTSVVVDDVALADDGDGRWSGDLRASSRLDAAVWHVVGTEGGVADFDHASPLNPTDNPIRLRSEAVLLTNSDYNFEYEQAGGEDLIDWALLGQEGDVRLQSRRDDGLLWTVPVDQILALGLGGLRLQVIGYRAETFVVGASTVTVVQGWIDHAEGRVEDPSG